MSDELITTESDNQSPTVDGQGENDRGNPPRPVRVGGARTTVLVGAGYSVLAVFLWWGVWSTHPSSVTTCGCGDAARFVWFFSWPAYALAHGMSPFHSTYLFHPSGINLLTDTSVLALGIVLTPVTWIFGPVAAMNVALTLAPMASALTMYLLLRRWVSWLPAAMIGGALFGFSPFVLTSLALNQLNIAFLAVPPLVVLLIDDLLVGQLIRPRRTGVALALLATVQFFLSTEILLITVLVTGATVVVLAVGCRWRAPEVFAERKAHAWRGGVTALGLSCVLLAWPLWYAVAGPSHLSGEVWGPGGVARFGTHLGSFLAPGTLEFSVSAMHRFGGYQGATLPDLGFLGAGLVLVALLGALRWRRDARIVLFVVLGAAAALCSLAPGQGSWVPWRLMAHLPGINDIVEARFVAVATFALAVVFALVVDHAHGGLVAHLAGRRSVPRAGVAGVIVLLLAGVAWWPTGSAVASEVPLVVRPVVVPHWFTAVAPHLNGHQVILAYPAPFSGLQGSQAWQAVDGMSWQQAGGGGPTGLASRAGAAAPGQVVLSAAALPLGPAPQTTPANVAAVRRALEIWKVTMVVAPDQPDLPIVLQGRSVSAYVDLLEAVLGRRPRWSHDAWVWTQVDRLVTVAGNR